MKQPKILLLTLAAKPFAVMVTGEKRIEYRKPHPEKGFKWLISRLVDKDTGENKQYDQVRFTNGYDHDSPYFTTAYLGWRYADSDFEVEFSNGLAVDVKKGDILIDLGHSIIESGYLKTR